MNKNDVKILLDNYGLTIESYKPGYTRLYAVYQDIKKISGYMQFKELCYWLKGYDSHEF